MTIKDLKTLIEGVADEVTVCVYSTHTDNIEYDEADFTFEGKAEYNNKRGDDVAGVIFALGC